MSRQPRIFKLYDVVHSLKQKCRTERSTSSGIIYVCVVVYVLKCRAVVLAINRYFDNPAFLNYLQYLKYWKQPQYAKYIVYVCDI